MAAGLGSLVCRGGLRAAHPCRTARIRPALADGSLGSRTALFHEPYADQPGTRGTRTIGLHDLRGLVGAAAGAGLQVAVHAIGDAAVDEVAALYAELAANHSSSQAAAAGQQQQRHRVEHAQHLSSPAAAARLAAAGAVVTPNPLHLPADAGVLEARLGRQRAGPGRSYAFRTLAAAGVTAAFGSDWPVVPLEPLAGAHGSARCKQGCCRGLLLLLHGAALLLR